jgi:hypothetical protein
MIEQTSTLESPSQPQIPAQEAPAPQAPPPAPAAPVINSPMRRSPFLAGALSIMPGLGQVYLGYYQLGFAHALVICTILTLLAADQLGSLIPLASVFMAFFWLYNIVDAARRAVMVNEALAGRSNIEVPDDFAAPGLRGSVVGGTIVVAIGLLLLSQTLFDVSLEWLEEWWPAVIVLFGAYLIFKAKGDQASSSAAIDE